MKKFIREFRIIPVVLIALCCLVVLKVAGLLQDGGYVLSDAQLPAESRKTILGSRTHSIFRPDAKSSIHRM